MTGPQFETLMGSLDDFGYVELIAINSDDTIVAGHQRISAMLAKERADEEIEVRVPNRKLTAREFKRYLLLSNKNRGAVDMEILERAFELDIILDSGFAKEELSWLNNYQDGEAEEAARKTLMERFIVPPFSVFDTRQGYWQERKRAWISLGIQSVEGRGESLMGYGKEIESFHHYRAKEKAKKKGRPLAQSLPVSIGAKYGRDTVQGTSIFDPVLCEIMYKWFCPAEGAILDPFAGGSVRGIIANYLGYQYTGVDLRGEQIEANVKQAKKVLQGRPEPKWIVGNSLKIDEVAAGKYDFVFSCPPYHDLELYSEDPEDLSNMPYAEFRRQYSEIIGKALSMLKEERFAVFIVGEIRDKEGFYKGFVGDTIRAFEAGGARFYNDAVLLNVAGTLPVRAAKQFNAGRKLGKMQQNVLVFYKGSPKNIRQNFPKIEEAEKLAHEEINNSQKETDSWETNLEQ